MSFSRALACTSFAERVAHVFIVALAPVIRVMRGLAALAPLDIADVVERPSVQASKKEALLAQAPTIAVKNWKIAQVSCLFHFKLYLWDL